MRQNRHVIVAAVALASAVTLQLGASTPAFAGTGHGSAQHYTVAPYSMDYTGYAAPDYTGPVDLGTWSCSGVRVTNNNMVRDNFTCSTTATDVTATFSADSPFPCGCGEWMSDFDGQVTDKFEIDISGGIVDGWAVYSHGG